MIVEPHFLTHWKTRRLVKLLGPVAPLYVLALWAYCQNRRTDRLRINAQELANICDFDANPQVLWDALIELRFLDLDGDDVIVHEWAEVNAILIGRWKGGDTMRKRRAGQQHGLTKDPVNVELTSSSAGTDGQAKVGGELELRSSEKSREEKSREEKKEEEESPPRVRARAGNPDDQDVVQHSEVQLALRDIAFRHYAKRITTWGMVKSWDDWLNAALPMRRVHLEALQWFYSLPDDHEIFKNQAHPALTNRKRTFDGLMQNLASEAEKAYVAKRAIDGERVKLPSWPTGMEKLFHDQWPGREMPKTLRELSGPDQDLLFDLRRKKNAAAF